jgi:hypothetical protein
MNRATQRAVVTADLVGASAIGRIVGLPPQAAHAFAVISTTRGDLVLVQNPWNQAVQPPNRSYGALFQANFYNIFYPNFRFVAIEDPTMLQPRKN